MSEGAPVEFGSYMVYEQLGIGGMAIVHVAESRSGGGFRKRVALKRLLPHAAENPELVKSFIHEARLARYLHHANIAQTFDFGKVGGTYFIAMEIAAGPTLSQLVRQCNSTIGNVPLPVALNLVCQVCDALDYAHKLVDEKGKPLGLIHRDVSPPNIIASNTGIVKLIDFGVAKAANSSLQTAVGTIKGKFSYVAPEYLEGKLSHRVDLWSLGVVTHELLTGRRLFDADDDFKVLARVRDGTLEPPSAINPAVPPELDTVVMTALERDPDKRWQSAASMKVALEGVQAQVGSVSNTELIDWVIKVFSKVPRGSSSEISQLIAGLEKPSQDSVSIEIGPPGRDSVPAKPVLKKSRIGSAMVRRRTKKSGAAPWLLFLLLVVAGGAGAVKYWGYERVWHALKTPAGR